MLSRDTPPANAVSWNGVLEDIFHRIDPLIFVRTTMPGSRLQTYRTRDVSKVFRDTRPSGAARGLLTQLGQRLTSARRFRGHIVGSNAWASSGEHTDIGGPIVAGDGHLALTAPAYFHQAGLNLSALGGEDWHVRGNFVAGIPALGVGTNGHVAWSFTCYYSDTIDYFHEHLVLDEDGQPAATEFEGERQPIQSTMQTYTIREAPALGSMGGTVQLPSFTLFDGRRLLSAEAVLRRKVNKALTSEMGFNRHPRHGRGRRHFSDQLRCNVLGCWRFTQWVF